MLPSTKVRQLVIITLTDCNQTVFSDRFYILNYLTALFVYNFFSSVLWYRGGAFRTVVLSEMRVARKSCSCGKSVSAIFSSFRM